MGELWKQLFPVNLDKLKYFDDHRSNKNSNKKTQTTERNSTRIKLVTIEITSSANLKMNKYIRTANKSLRLFVSEREYQITQRASIFYNIARDFDEVRKSGGSH